MTIVLSSGHRRNRSHFAGPRPQRCYEAVIERVSRQGEAPERQSSKPQPCRLASPQMFSNRIRISDQTYAKAVQLTQDDTISAEERAAALIIRLAWRGLR